MSSHALATPPALTVRHQRAEGTGRISTQARDGGTHLARLYQEGCAKVRLPRTHASHLEAVLINTAGGLTGGDRLSWSATAAPGTELVLTTQACERVYRSLGTPAEIRTQVSAGGGARLYWLPQETILFEDSQLVRTLEVDLAPDARFLAVEAILLGRDAMGEAARRAAITENWRVRRGGRLLHAEANRLEGLEIERDGRSLLGGARAFASLLYVGPDTERQQTRLEGVLGRGDRLGASRMGDRLVIRALADSGLALRRLIVPILAALAPGGTLPRLWHL